MLNELYKLSFALEKQGLLPSANTHRDVHKLAKCECLYLRLSAEGKPVSMKLLNQKETAVLWVHSKGNHVRFPAVRVQTPLLAVPVSDAFDAARWKKADLSEKRSILAALDFTAENTASKDIQLKPWTLEQMEPVLKNEEPELEALRRLLQRFPGADNAEFYAALRQFILSRIGEIDERTANFLQKLLVGAYDEKSKKYAAGCMCYFDIEELSQVECAVASAELEDALIQCLLKAQPDAPEEEEEGSTSALSGTRERLVTDKFPNPKFQVIGPSYLFSNNTGASPCLLRYNMEGTQAFPAGAGQVQRMCDALSFLMEDSRKDKTWTSFPGPSGDKPMLLMAWLEDDPECEAKLARVVGEDGAAAAYEKMCQDALELLKAKCDSDPMSFVHLLLFQTYDPGRKQLSLSLSMHIKQLYDDVNAWIVASKNIPSIYFRVNFKNKGGKPVTVYRPHCPGPGAVCRLLRTQYRCLDGAKAGRLQDSSASALTLQEIYRLFLPGVRNGRGEDRFLSMCLEAVLRTGGELLADAGRFQTAAFKEQPFTEDGMERACTAVSMLGILLYRRGIRKENYMESKMFLAGRMLKLADRLHKNYCIIVRNNETLQSPSKSIPGQLMGNAVFQMALQNPTEALNRLAEKLPIYLAWADTDFQSKSKWILRLLEQTTLALGQDGEPLPQKPTADEKAQLLLGYLAELPNEEKAKAGTLENVPKDAETLENEPKNKEE